MKQLIHVSAIKLLSRVNTGGKLFIRDTIVVFSLNYTGTYTELTTEILLKRYSTNTACI